MAIKLSDGAGDWGEIIFADRLQQGNNSNIKTT